MVSPHFEVTMFCKSHVTHFYCLTNEIKVDITTYSCTRFACHHYSLLAIISGLTIVGHAHREAFVEPAVLALVAVLLLDFAVAFALVILQL